jgi:hypothetical protein
MAQLFDVIFDDLRSSKKSVNRLLSIGILFALIGHFYIVEPYFQYKAQEHIWLEMREKIKEVSESLFKIQQQVKDYPDHMQKVKDQIWDVLLSGPASDALQIGEITLPIKKKNIDDAFKGAVGLYVKNWFPNLIEQFKKPIMELKNLAAVTDASEILSKVPIMADEAAKNFQTGLEALEAEDPDIWKDYSGPRAAAATQLLQGIVEDSFGPIQKEIPSLHQIARKSLKKVEKNIGQLEPRINSLVSQLGPVPVSLKDFIVLFPFFMVALLVMITAALHKSGYLYLAFWREYSRQNTTKDREAFQLFADCWYLPTKKSIVKLLLLSILLSVVSGFFIRASLLVISNADAELFTLLFPVEDSPTNMFPTEESPTNLSPAEESSTKNVFTGAYIFGAFVVVGCFGLIFKTLRRIAQELIE